MISILIVSPSGKDIDLIKSSLPSGCQVKSANDIEGLT